MTIEKPPAASAPIVEMKDVRRMFGETAAINGVSLSVSRGEILGIIGRSGAGKSTLIRCVNGLEKPDTGSILIEGREITGLGEDALRPVRRRIGMVFQHFNLLSAKTVAENIALPLKIAGKPKAERARRVAELLELVGLSDKATHYPAQLSGGQKQRVGIARALAAEPAVLLSDEATSALDPETTQSILALLKDINTKLGLTILLITHEMEVIRRIADRVIVLDHGMIAEEGPVWKVFANPQSPVTQSMLQVLTPELPVVWRDRLQNSGNLAVLKVRLSGAAAKGAFFNDIAAATQIAPQLIHGGMDTIQGEPVGTLFIGLPAQEKAKLDAAITYLDTHADATEVLGYVSGDA
ncbi:methionine ABC transporter ATP-binding protein [Brucella sp. ZJ1_1]|uniref:Cell division ATP-binding protein FtsE n=5 Tax=Brucella intermedia TaxID=94625 RepID=U4V7S0_9HYPH|nr:MULTISPECIES: methionine ABC transporter ATP-binding protein [Brucella/Ochrobactrum group]ERM01068.1 arginine ABC transporter ATP-binding protein [Brucella intermedia 229E]MCH6205356.1 methionine ABC transporter ATP-binding protein [Brucella ciceri]EEQ96446.1 Methionine import ATP-binding protein metN [Brucella intermedia LMG 3301]ELT49696.1 ABC transporter ATP-binding protein [Brucella intermedia M86]KAB2692753.1 methionine ABC transporter ATP-binding protein [Brucella intermedia]